MSKANPIYTSFNAGELSELLLGRSDLDQFFKGGLEYKNLIVTQYGPFCTRPGSMYQANTKGDVPARLLEFVFSPADAQFIEMGALYFRFYTSAGQISGPLEVVHTYTTGEIDDVHYAQSNDVITLNHLDHKPAKLTRVTPSSWSLADYVFKGNPYLDPNIVEADLLTPSTLTKDATGTLTATGGHTPFTLGHVGSFWRVGAPTGSPEKQGYVEITGFTSTTVVAIKVIETLAGTSATDDWAEAAWSDERGWPSRVAYHKNRLWFLKSPKQPNGAWGSKPFIYDNFDPGTGLDDDAISEQIPDAADIRWAIGGRTLLVGTDKGEYTANEDAATGLTPASTSFNRQTNWSSEAIQPKIIGNYVYPIQEGGRKVREIFYSFEQDSYRSGDTTAVAEHITKSGIKAVAYQRNPYSIMPCVLNNGKMACMTRESDQQVLAWTPFDTEEGVAKYISVAAIPHPTENYDIVGVVVERTIDGSTEHHVEFFENPTIPDRQELNFYVDDGVRFNAYTSNVGGTLTLDAVSGDAIEFVAGSAVFTAGQVGQRIRAIDTVTGEILGEGRIVAFTDTTHIDVDILADKPFTTTTYAANTWGISVNTISGFTHLNAKTVKMLADGGTVADETVVAGSITLADGDDAFIVALGLKFISRWKNMPIEAGGERGTAQGQKKRPYRMDYIFYRSLGMKAGGDVDHLDKIIPRDSSTLMGQAEPVFTGIFPGNAIDTTYNVEGHIVIQQDEPLPMCLLAIIPHVQTNEV